MNVCDKAQRCVIKLSGSLARLFGREHVRYLESGTTREVLNALKNTLPGFEAAIRAQGQKGLAYALFRNRENIGEERLNMAGTREIRIVPVLQGAKRAGVFNVILGAVLIIAGAIITNLSYGWAAPVGEQMMYAGYGMVVGGVVQMLMPVPKGLKQREAEENKPSYAFGGPTNTTAAGHPVPLVYGRRRIGGAIISAGIYAEDLA